MIDRNSFLTYQVVVWLAQHAMPGLSCPLTQNRRSVGVPATVLHLRHNGPISQHPRHRPSTCMYTRILLRMRCNMLMQLESRLISAMLRLGDLFCEELDLLRFEFHFHLLLLTLRLSETLSQSRDLLVCFHRRAGRLTFSSSFCTTGR